MSLPDRPIRDDKLLVALLFEVNRARARVREGRSAEQRPLNRQEQQDRREHLVGALEAYADAASAAGVPLPYRYRDEMRMYRALTGTSPVARRD